MTEFVSLERFREEAQRLPTHLRASAPDPTGPLGLIGPLTRVSAAEPKALPDGRRGFRFCFSDGSVDRMGDIIDPAGWDTRDFLKNPVALWAHDSSSPPIGRASNIKVEGNRLMGDIEFAEKDVYAFAETIYRLVENKFINAVSVGFLPLEWKWAEDDDDRRWGMDFQRQELLEISVVPVPANAHALIEARANGIDVKPLQEWAEKILDSGDRVWLTKSEFAQLRKLAKVADVARKPKKSTAPAFAPLKISDADIKFIRALRAPNDMSETDPSSGGNLVDCGKGEDEPCGLDDPSKCMIHGNHDKDADGDNDEDDEMDEKAIVALVRREVSRGIKSGIKELITEMRVAAPVQREAGDDEPENVHVEHMKAGHFHAKECVKCIRKALDAFEGDGGGGEDPEEANPEGETSKADRMAIAKELQAAIKAV
jgi:HK97 family phage prohead protease